MKSKFKIISICILAVFLIRICLSKEKKNDKAVIAASAKMVEVQVTPSLPKVLHPVNTKIFGVNIGFALARELDKDSGFVQLLRAMHPTSLRFPGGTVANWYHPDLPVYGYKKEELFPSLGGLYALQSKRSENILYNYIRLSKAVGSGAVFCANLLNGTTEEALFVLDELKKNNIPVLGVELGNEFCLLPYRTKEFPSGDVYIKRVKATAEAIKAKYPDIKLAVVGAEIVADNDHGERGKFMRTWNQQLSKVNFYDAYVWHYYANCEACDKEEYFDNIYLKNLQNMAPYKTNKVYDVGAGYVKLYGSQRKLWMTEWNISNTAFLENTFTQAAFVYENFLNIIDINIKYDNYIEISNLHAMDALINTYKGKQKPLLSNDDENATTQYFAFKFLANTLTEDVCRAEQMITCKDASVKNNFVCNAFLRKSDNKVFLHYVNRSGNKIQLSITAKPNTTYTITAIDADVPYATAGKTLYEKDYPNKVKPVRLREETFTHDKVTIAPFSFGYISYNAQ